MSELSQKVSAVVFVVLLPVAGWLTWKKYFPEHTWKQDAPTNSAQISGADTPGDAVASITAEKPITEGHWLADQTGRNVAELLAFAKNAGGALQWASKPVPRQPQTYTFQAEIDGQPLTANIPVKDYIWSPSDYSQWARSLAARWKLQATPATKAPADFLTTLATATPAALQAQSQRISTALSATPLDASLHEQAALVIASFALREAAGDFSDIRRELSRMAAHLAVARALQETAPDSIRAFAECALNTLVGREVAALAILDKLPQDIAGSASWNRALRLRNTGDWRAEGDPTIPLEAIEGFHARASSVNAHFAILWLEKLAAAPKYDWHRMVLEKDFGVSDGHKFANESIKSEVTSLQENWNTVHGKPLERQDLIKALTEPAAGPVVRNAAGQGTVQVLGWDLWSAQQQRHLCNSIRGTNRFLRDKWGVSQYRDAQKSIKQTFAGMDLFPLLERELNDKPGDAAEIGKRVSALIERRPDLISPALWSSLREQGRSKLPPLAIASPDRWFNPLVASGTTYGFDLRSSGFSLPYGGSEFWKDLIALAPSNYQLRFGKLWKEFGENMPAEATEKEFAPILDYNHRAMVRLARVQKGQSDKYPATMEKVCAIDPDYYFNLGDWYVSVQQPEKAANAYQQGVDLGEDRVAASNQCEWLVNYYEDNGQGGRATAVATMAADVYSSSGLETLAKLHERRGELAQAADVFAKIEERYEDHCDLRLFHHRHRATNPASEKYLAEAELKLFPNGVKKVTVADFQDAPKSGARVIKDSPIAGQVGITKGTIIVALNGQQIETQAQYFYIRSLLSTPDLNLIIWNGSAYSEVSAAPPKRTFGIDFEDVTTPQ